jgi:hypothetical protein
MSSAGTGKFRQSHADDRITIQKRSKQGSGCAFVTVRTKPQSHPSAGIPIVFSEEARAVQYANPQRDMRNMHGQVLMAIAEACVKSSALTTAFTALECIRVSDDAVPVVNKLALMSPCGITPSDFVGILKEAVESTVPGFPGVFDLVSDESKFATKGSGSKDAPDDAAASFSPSSLSVYLTHKDANLFLCTVSDFPNLEDVFSRGLGIPDITWTVPLSIQGKQFDVLQLLPPLLVRSLRDHGSPRIAAHLEAIIENSTTKTWRGKTLPTEAVAKLEKLAPGLAAAGQEAAVFDSLSRASANLWPSLISLADELIQLPYIPQFPVAFPVLFPQELNNLHQYARYIHASSPGMSGWQAYARASSTAMPMRAGLWQLLLLPFLALNADAYNPLMFV